MPRKKQFGIDEVKEKAMVAFWDHGYRATSLQDLVDTM
ncbi:MAG: TetR/AcrR family transcriptional regulator, partial [Nitrospira sp. SB0666_bin_27]|nr:TetR/AcrR family transcriptional regulator [Nitrospira sp. SB0666_bin_27]